MKQLSSRLALEDVQPHDVHIKMTDFWFSVPNPAGETPIGLREPDGCVLSAQINWRWKLWTAANGTFPSEAFELVSSMARKLASFLPAEEMPHVPAPVGGGGGGTPGAAEFGIPGSWAREARN